MLGGAGEPIAVLLIDCLYLTDARTSDLAIAGGAMTALTSDPRYEALVAPTKALLRHINRERCPGDCLRELDALARWDSRGAHFLAVAGYVKLGVLALEHGGRRNARKAVRALLRARGSGLLRYMRWWIRRYVPYWQSWILEEGASELLANLLEADPDVWRAPVAQALHQGPRARPRNSPHCAGPARE
jgi:hypothetical protein